MAWTTLPAEASLLDSLAGNPRVQVDTIGNSVQGRLIRLVRIGDPPPDDTARTLFLTGGVHGNEPAGREALLQLAQHLATTGDTAEVDFLTNYGVMLVPTVNPDGFNTLVRRNANNVDINRDFMALAQPETRAVAAALGRARPIVQWDMHEYLPTTPPGTLVVQVNRAAPAQAHTLTKARALAMRTLMLARADTEGWANAIWGALTRGDITLLDISSGIRHSIAGIVETNRSNDTTAGRNFRAAVQFAMAQEILGYCVANMTDLVDDVEAAEAAKTAEGATASEPFNLRGGVILNPPPTGYELTGSQQTLTTFHRQAYNITLTGSTAEMEQAAQPVIPYLFDAESQYAIVAATRLGGDTQPGGGDDDDEEPEQPGEPAPPPIPEAALPAGVARPVVDWHACDLVTGRIITTLRDIRSEGPIGRRLGAYETAHLVLPIPAVGPREATLSQRARLAEQATVPGRTLIVAVVNDQPAWGGIVMDDPAGTGPLIELTVHTLEAYLVRRRVRDHTFTQVDEADIYAALLGDAGDRDVPGVGTVGGIGLEVDAPPTGVLRDDTYHRTDRATVYDRLRERMARQGGLEWTIELLWGDATHTWVRKVVRVRPRIGVASPTPAAVFETTAGSVFSSQGASETTYTRRRDYTRGANWIEAYSVGEGEDQPASSPAVAADLLANGWPIYERHWMPSSSITDVATLDDHARRDLELRRNGARTWSIEARWNVYPRLNVDWRIGDDIAWRLLGHLHPDGTVGQGRAIGWELNPDSGYVRPTLLDPVSMGDD